MGRARVAQLAVSRRGRGFVVCASRLLRGAKKHRAAVILDTSVSIRVPARTPLVSICQHGPCAEVREATGLTFFSLLHFGGFAPRAWRLAGVCRSSGREKKNRVFFDIAPARLVLF